MKRFVFVLLIAVMVIGSISHASSESRLVDPNNPAMGRILPCGRIVMNNTGINDTKSNFANYKATNTTATQKASDAFSSSNKVKRNN